MNIFYADKLAISIIATRSSGQQTSVFLGDGISRQVFHIIIFYLRIFTIQIFIVLIIEAITFSTWRVAMNQSRS